MTGCPAAIAAARPYLEAKARCPALAYGLHLRGGKCRRMGGDRVCSDCVGDLRPQDMPSNRSGAPLSGLKPVLATPQRPEQNRLSDGR